MINIWFDERVAAGAAAREGWSVFAQPPERRTRGLDVFSHGLFSRGIKLIFMYCPKIG
jgi:hypothetical protein